MGQYGSRSSVETRVIFQHAVTEDACPKTDACSTPTSVVHFQKRVTLPASCTYHPSARAPEKVVPHSWPPSHRDAGGLVYVMDNPTGGVWVKPKEIWTRTWQEIKLFFSKIPLNWSEESVEMWLDAFCGPHLASSEQQVPFLRVCSAHPLCSVRRENWRADWADHYNWSIGTLWNIHRSRVRLRRTRWASHSEHRTTTLFSELCWIYDNMSTYVWLSKT